MGRINSRDKGKNGELEVAKALRDAGYKDARRSQQYAGHNDAEDIYAKDLSYLAKEVKRDEKLKLEEWLNQASWDTNGKPPIVFHRKNNERLKVTMFFDDFAKIFLTKVYPPTDLNLQHRSD